MQSYDSMMRLAPEIAQVLVIRIKKPTVPAHTSGNLIGSKLATNKTCDCKTHSCC